ncbi:DUF6232 family protein [Paraburkholderia sacchari]|uniref:DUF6232 family protein n=1 Tax=Paraburkholderia sacchari TaxID=159450 RepID=UPI003D973768
MKEKKETVIFNEGQVTVTDVRFITPSETYAMSGVTSVRTLREEPKRTALICLGLVGVIFAVFATTLAMHIVGAFVAVAAAAAAARQRPTFFLVIKTASGESRAVVSQNHEFINRVVGAVNDAIVIRG